MIGVEQKRKEIWTWWTGAHQRWTRGSSAPAQMPYNNPSDYIREQEVEPRDSSLPRDNGIWRELPLGTGQTARSWCLMISLIVEERAVSPLATVTRNCCIALGSTSILHNKPSTSTASASVAGRPGHGHGEA